MRTPGSYLHVQREPFFGDRFDFLCRNVTDEPRPQIARALPLVFEVIDQNTYQGQELAPTFSLQPSAAQELMDELWRCGLRPTAGHGSAGAIAATERHLEDMRALVFKTPAPKRTA